MTNTYEKSIGTLALLLVIAMAPASLAFAQTTFDSDDEESRLEKNQGIENDVNDDDRDEKERANERKEEIKKMREELLQRKDSLKEQMRNDAKQTRVDLRDADRIADLKFNGTTSGWAIVGNTAHPSSIELAGEAYNVGGSTWMLKSAGSLKVGDRDVILELKGHARGNMILLHGAGTLSDGESVRIHLKGHFAPTGNENEFALAFTNASVQYLESGIRIQLMQVGSATVLPIMEPTPTPVPVEPVVLAPAQ